MTTSQSEPRRASRAQSARQRPRLAVWLTLMTLGLVLLVAAALAPLGWSLLRQLAVDNARSRLQLAALGAAEGLERYAGEALTGARLLAERPTLLRLVESGRAGELVPFLDQFRTTSDIDGCAVISQGAVLASSPADLPWDSIREEARAGLRYVEPPEAEKAPLAVASAILAGRSDSQAIAVRRLGGELALLLQEQVGSPVTVRVPAVIEPDASVAFLDDGKGGSWRARRSVVVEAQDRSSSAVELEATLSEEAANSSLAPLQRTFMWVTVGSGAIAVAAGIFAARRLSQPLVALRSAAERIAGGDLATPVPITAGAEAGALASTMEDMRRRLRAATTELRHRQAEASALLEGIQEGVFAVNAERRIQYINPQAARQLGTSPDAALGRFCGDVLRAVDRDGNRPCDHACPIVHARSRGSSRAVEYLDLPGGRRTVVITSAPPAGERQVQLLRDETEIEAARRSRDAVLANVSHELKTPLSAQLASLELLRDGLESKMSTSDLELIASLERSTLRLTRLIDNLLESVRIETGKATFRRVPVDIATIVEDARAMTDPLLRQRRQQLDVELPARLSAVVGDPVQLTQVLVNLLANANKFAPEGSAIRLGAAAANGVISVWVEDSGPGIPEAESTSVFEHYHRVDPGAAEGVGLGLGIVKSIVERHGGRIEVSSSPSKGGARFTVTLPAGGDE